MFTSNDIINLPLDVSGLIKSLQLAAIATFNKPDIDKTMPVPAPKIDILVQGKRAVIELTRRRFLCSMFAFLTAESLILIVLAIFAQSAYIPNKGNDSSSMLNMGIWIIYLSFLFAFLANDCSHFLGAILFRR
ncbi:hypothetical protein [Methyloglobulus sp.]|uniref:hypothetical protein n=1 Tax=Methyloglobulus sp. TaxID=2518622 RepID=UPI0032B72CB1